MTYALPDSGNDNEEYKVLAPVQMPITAPYLSAMEKKRKGFFNEQMSKK
jgi:tRNA (cytidine32/guanosine34-2'-O)-methyltransferase